MRNLVLNSLSDSKQKEIAEKIFSDQRINEEEGLYLFQYSELGTLAILADHIRKKHNNNKLYFNRNVHLEPTNICIHNCKFCSYSRKIGQDGAWENSLEEVQKIVKAHHKKDITEIHIVGGVHPHRNVDYYAQLLKIVREELPTVHIKAFTAAEIEHMAKKAGLQINEALQLLKNSGLDSMPGGGAEIFDEKIRKQICPDKTGSDDWLKVHKTAHEMGIPSTCTILYGHIEKYEHRINHLSRLRNLQDETGGFNAFIPLKYKSRDNEMHDVGEVSVTEDLRNFAVSRIFLDNIPHLKAYWPMTGKEIASIALSFGVDDIDGTIQDTTKIYSMAGAEEQKPSLSIQEIQEMAQRNHRIAVERNSLYDPLKIFNS